MMKFPVFILVAIILIISGCTNKRQPNNRTNQNSGQYTNSQAGNPRLQNPNSVGQQSVRIKQQSGNPNYPNFPIKNSPNRSTANITVYSLQACPASDDPRQYFSQQGIQYKFVDIGTSNGLQQLNHSGGSHIFDGRPVIQICNRWMSGWNENKFRRLLANCNNQQSGSGRQGNFNQNSSNQNVPVATHPSDSVNLNANEIKQLLNVHNQVRAEVGVSALAWSPSLALYAQNWSNHLSSTICNLQHRQPNQYGENIFMGTQGAYQAKDAVFSWAAEKKDYHGGVLTQSNWHPAGHYTQVVWRNTQQVGCGKSLCGGNMIVVCNYQPAGNMMGQKPY